MPANYLHGVETIEIDKGPRPVRGVKTAVVGLVGTAPSGPVNTPTLVQSDRDAAQFLQGETDGHTIGPALDAIFDQGKGIVVAVNVFDKEKHTSVDDITAADIIGGMNAAGKRTGMQAFKDVYSRMGFNPKILISPVYGCLTSVATELDIMAKTLRAVSLVDAPVGTAYADVIAGRGPEGAINFATSSDRTILCYPHLEVYDTKTNANRLEPLSQRLAGVMCAKDMDQGYWFSPSNTEIKGVVGVERSLTAAINDPTSEVNLLNENGIVTVFNSFGTGLRTWGNRSAAWPSETHPKNFINVRRVADVLHESIEYAMLPFLDRPITNALIDDIAETVNGFIRTLIGRGALIDGRCWWDPAKNPETEIALGHLTFDLEFMPPLPAERISFQSFININLLALLGQEG